MAAAVLRLAREPGSAGELGAAGRERVERMFTLERQADGIDAAYRGGTRSGRGSDRRARAAETGLRQISRTDRRILLVSAATVASRVGSKLAQLGFLVVAARLLSVEEFAGYSYLLVLAVTFSMLADTGVALAASREISAGRRSAADAFWSGLPVIGLAASPAAGWCSAFGLLDSAPGSAGTALVLTCGFVVANTLFNFARPPCAASAGRSTRRSAGRGRARLRRRRGDGAGARRRPGDGARHPARQGAPVAGRRPGRPAADIGARGAHIRDLWRRLLRIGIQLGLASTALALVTRIPTFVLGNSGTTEELAWFSAAQRLADAVLVLATTSGFALLPSLTLLLETSASAPGGFLRRCSGRRRGRRVDRRRALPSPPRS